MTTDTQNHKAIRSLLENALQQVLSTQEQVAVIESRLQDIKSQIDLSLEAIDPVLKQLETGDQAEKVRSDVAATLGEVIEHVSRIVNDAREQMLNPRCDESDSQDVSPHVTGAITEAVNEATREELAETNFDEPTPVVSLAESLLDESLSTESPASDSLTGPQVGQRATESLNEMIATIDETNAETGTSLEDGIPGSESVTEIEAQAIVSREPETEREQLPETVASEPALFEAEVKSAEKEAPKGPGSTDSLSELLAKAKAASSETGLPATDLAPLDDDEEDVQAVSELLKTTSGSFATQ